MNVFSDEQRQLYAGTVAGQMKGSYLHIDACIDQVETWIIQLYLYIFFFLLPVAKRVNKSYATPGFIDWNCS